MVSPFDIAWAVLKSHDDEFPPMPFYSSTDQGYDPERTQWQSTGPEDARKPGKITHHPEPEYPPEEAEEEMEPSLEESQAMAPDVSAEEILDSLPSDWHETLRQHFTGGSQ